MAMRRTAARLKHYWSTGGAQYIGSWEHVPPTLGTALKPVTYIDKPKIQDIPKDWVMRGTGIHGPENPEVMKLVLWNRLKQRRPQRTGADIETLREFYRMEVAIVWWMFGLCFMVAPLNWWGKKYRIVHDHYPWAPKRHDGTRGFGPYTWFLE